MKIFYLLAILIPLVSCHGDEGHYTTRYPWCVDDHVHINTLSETVLYLNKTGRDMNNGYGQTQLQALVDDALKRVGCENVTVEGEDCCQSVTAANIYTVLDMEETDPLNPIQNERANTILLTFLYDLEHKCEEEIVWEDMHYHDFVDELMHFHYHDHDHLDDGIHDNGDNNLLDDGGHDHDHFEADQLEGVMREINETYTPGDWLTTGEDEEEEGCWGEGAWRVMSRTIWRDVHMHGSAIDEDELGEMATILNLYLLHGYCLVEDRVLEDEILPLQDDFIRSLFNNYGHDCHIDERGFEDILEALGIEDAHGHEPHSVDTSSSSQDDVDGRDHHDHDHDHDHEGPYGPDVAQSCFSGHDLQDIFYKDLHHHDLEREDFLTLCPALVQQSIEGCQYHHHHDDEAPTDAEKYGFGTLAVFIITITSLLGLVLARWRTKAVYRRVISTVLGLAVGTLVGDAMLHLIPHGLGLHDHSDDGHGHAHDHSGVEPYVWRMLCVCGSIWAFFLLQVFLGELSAKYAKRQITEDTVNGISGQYMGHNNVAFEPEEGATEKKIAPTDTPMTATDSNHIETPGEVAYMAMVGDAFHNLADGLAIGAAFSIDLAMGLSTSIAVFCHEVPHELGDVAICLSAGWSVKRIASLQLLTGATAFVGLYIGIAVSQNAEAQEWILIIAGGMFIYVALSDLVPEILASCKDKEDWSLFILANVGILFGFTVMILLSVYEEDIVI